MLTQMAAQALTDGLAAVAMAAVAIDLVRQRLISPIQRRLALLLGVLALFYGTRGTAEATGVAFLDRLALVLACAVPLGVLLLAEGLLRRHAPRALKILVVGGGLVMAILLLAAGEETWARTWTLGVYVLGALVCVLILLLTRDRGSLSRQENIGVEAMMAVGVGMILLAATDFLPGMVGLSGVGAAAVGFFVQSGPTSPQETRATLLRLAATAIVALLAAWAFTGPLGLAAGAAPFRFATTLVALLLAVSALGIGPKRPQPRGRRFAEALAAANTASLTAFLSDLADQPRLAGLRLVEEPQLAEYELAGLAEAMARRGLWTRTALRDGLMALSPRARDELDDLMARSDATHAVMLSPSPLRIALFTLPAIVADEAETDLKLFGKLAALTADRP